MKNDPNKNGMTYASHTLPSLHKGRGVEHTRQITGGPQESMMSFEDPETFRQIVSIAPAEGQSPLAIMTDPDFEAMFNPDKFC